MTQVVRTQKAEAIAHFQYEGRLIQDVPFGNGHITDTYLLTFEVKRMGILKVILQKMNKNVFKNPVELMENILGVTSYLREKIIKKGNKMAAKINNDAVADVERLLIKLLRRADGIPPPAVQRSWFSDGLDDGLRRLAQALQRGRQVGRTL